MNLYRSAIWADVSTDCRKQPTMSSTAGPPQGFGILVGVYGFFYAKSAESMMHTL